jgi:hypothetical protein
MLDEAEFSSVISKRAAGVEGDLGSGLYEAALAEYERITGYRETNFAAVWHHRLALYGPPCKSCGKPLRTPQAKLCGSCMAPATGIRPPDKELLPDGAALTSDTRLTPRIPPTEAHRLNWFKQLLLLFAVMSVVALVAKLANQGKPESTPTSAKSLEPDVIVSYTLRDLSHVGESATYTARADGRLVVIVPDGERSCGVEPQGSRTEVSTEEPFAPSFIEQNGPVKLALLDDGSLGKYWELQQQQTLILKKGRTENVESCSVTVRFE